MDRTLAPQNISPLIKGARWTLLLAGIVYGSVRLNFLQRRERVRLDELERTRPEREAKQKVEKELRTKAELEDLAKQLGQAIS